MSERGKAGRPEGLKAWRRFSLRALFFAVLAALTRYFAGLALGSHTSAEYFESFASRWFVMVPLFLALGAVWALLDGCVTGWAKKREARRAGGDETDKAE